MALTFVNISDGPSLSRQAAYQMRGHITKHNFAARRDKRRKVAAVSNSRNRSSQAKTSTTTTTTTTHTVAGTLQLSADTNESFNDLVALSTSQVCPRRLEICTLKALEAVILRGQSSEQDAGRRSLIYSEPALAEAMLSVIVLYYTSPSFECRKLSQGSNTQASPTRVLAELHSRRALALAIERVGSQKAHTDGLLETVETLALGARFRGDADAYNIHVGGMVDILRSRRERGIVDMPPALRDEIILGLFDRVLGCPRIYHEKIVEEASRTHPIIANLATLTEELILFRQRAAHIRATTQDDPSRLPSSPAAAWMRLSLSVSALRLHPNVYVCAVAVAMVILLRISVPGDNDDGTVGDCAAELKGIVAGFPHRWCALMDVTSCVMWLGAVVARRGSEAEGWFTGRLRDGMGVLRVEEWRGMYEGLRRGLGRESWDLRGRFEEKWREVAGES